MEMVVATKVTYKYLMNQSKHDLAQMVLDLLKKEEMQNNDLASVCRVSYHVFVDGVCAECGLERRKMKTAIELYPEYAKTEQENGYFYGPGDYPPFS